MSETPPAPPAAPPPTSVPSVPPAETFSREYVTELRNEAKGYRLGRDEAARKAEEAARALEAAKAETEQRIAAAQAAADQRIIRAELKAEAVKAGMIDLDGLKLADLSKVKLSESGDVEGADALITALKEAKPYLFAHQGTTSSTHTPPKPGDQGKKVSEMTAEEYAAHKRSVLSQAR